MTRHDASDRSGEWFVPSIGPRQFRIMLGLLFLPYTGMVLAYTVIGSMLADFIHWDRAIAIVVIYFLALGIGAHALDALGSKGLKPWGQIGSARGLWGVALSAIALAYIIVIYYIITAVPFLAVFAVVEGFFLFAYNLEWFNGRFHTDGWFALSWGGLPVLAGYTMQTNRLSVTAVLMGTAMALLSVVEITASRSYKALKRASREAQIGHEQHEHLKRYERILKSLSFGVIVLGLALLAWRLLPEFSSH
jgi:hypothetical protein